MSGQALMLDSFLSFFFFFYLHRRGCVSTPVCLFIRWLVGWLVCQQDYTKTTECISNETWVDDGIDPESTSLTLGVNLNKGMDPGNFLSISTCTTS